MATPAFTTICTDDGFASQTICEVIQQLDRLTDQSIEMRDTALAAIAELKEATTDGVTSMQGINYSVNTSGVNKDFIPPGDIGSVPNFSALGPASPTFPAAPTIDDSLAVEEAPVVANAYVVPPATTQLITNDTFNAIHARETDRLAEIGVKEERDAFYLQSSRGIGLATTAKTAALAEAEERTDLRVADATRDKAVQEGLHLREDVKTLHELQIQNWPLHPRLVLDSYKAEEGLEVDAYKARELAKTQGYASIVQGLANAYDSEIKWVLGYLAAETQRHQVMLSEFKAELESEAERRNWSQMEINLILTEADKLTGYAITKSQFLLDTTRETSQAVAQLLAGMTQALYSAASYHLGGSGSHSISN